MKRPAEKIEQAIANAGKTSTDGVSAARRRRRAFYNGDWLKRAAVADGGIYANDPEEAAIPVRAQ